jgi:hypothetical protein
LAARHGRSRPARLKEAKADQPADLAARLADADAVMGGDAAHQVGIN